MVVRAAGELQVGLADLRSRSVRQTMDHLRVIGRDFGREGIIELIGDNRPLPIGQRLALSGIFNKVLSRNRQLHIINVQIAQSPQLRDQQVTQFVIHDGWIGVALGPKAPGRQAAMYPRTPLERE